MERFDGATAARWAHLAAERLDEQRAWINSINVFPVADSDTGTNSLLTLTGGLEAVAELDPAAGVTEVLRAFARGALLAARGNSGVIISQFVGGMAAHLADDAPLALDAEDLSRALRAGHRAAKGAVADPAPGTVLSATRRSSKAARRSAKEGAQVAEVCRAALDGAREAARRSPEELEVLAKAGVVDAGASVLVILLEALVEAVTGERPAFSGALAGGKVTATEPEIATPDLACVPAAGSDGEFEVMFLLEAEPDPGLGDVLRARLAEHGQSVAVVGDTGMWQAHVHTDHPAAALAAGALGPQRQAVVRHLALGAVTPDAEGLGLVAAVSEPGLLAEAARTGAVVHVPSSPPASPAELRRACQDTGAARVAVVGADDATLAVARGLGYDVVPVRDGLHAVLALSALVASEAGAHDAEDALRLLRESADHVRTAPLTTPAGDLDELARGAEVVAVLHGSLVPDGLLDSLERVARAAGAAEFVTLGSGHADDALVAGVT